MTTEQDLLNMAEDCKNIVARKDHYIRLQQEKIDEVEPYLRDCEYKLAQLDFLIQYKRDVSSKEEKAFLKRLDEAIKFLTKKIDRGRCTLQEELDEEEILLMLNIVGST
jgi:hypothetical protein